MLRETTGSPTVPQIVIDGEPIGGADAVYTLDRQGVLLPRVCGDEFPVALVTRRRWVLRPILRRPQRYVVRLRDRDGRTLGRAAAESADEAARRAEDLKSEHSAPARVPRS
jgi:hypothetical protein